MRLPIVKQLFSNNDSTIKQTDIVMLLTPRIIRTHDLRAQDLSPIYIGTQSNMSLTGPPATIGGAAGARCRGAAAGRRARGRRRRRGRRPRRRPRQWRHPQRRSRRRSRRPRRCCRPAARSVRSCRRAARRFPAWCRRRRRRRRRRRATSPYSRRRRSAAGSGRPRRPRPPRRPPTSGARRDATSRRRRAGADHAEPAERNARRQRTVHDSDLDRGRDARLDADAVDHL